jgi:hypothetical protein
MDNQAINRRSGPDPLVKLIKSITAFSWMLLFFTSVFLWVLISSVFIVSRVTKNPLEAFNNSNRFNLSENWKTVIMDYSFYLVIILFVLCSAGLILNSFRHNRKGDTYSKPLIIFLILSVAGIILHKIFL